MIKKLTKSKGFTLLIMAIVLTVVIYLIKPTFLAKLNVRTMLNEITLVFVIVCGVVPLLISGGVNLGASAEASMGAIIFAFCCKVMPWGIALVIALIAGACFGLIIVGLGKAFGLMPFIISLGLSSVYSGLGTVITGANNIMISQQSFTNINKAALFGGYVPVLFIVSVVFLIVYALIMKFTRFGRNAYMTGGNPVAARLAGINGSKVQAIMFVNAGVIHVLTGIMWACQKKMANSTSITILSPNFTAMSAAVLGGVAFGGGTGTIGGAFCGVVLVKVFTSGVISLGLASYWSVILQGAVLLVALMLDYLSQARAENARRKAAMAGTTAQAA